MVDVALVAGALSATHQQSLSPLRRRSDHLFVLLKHLPRESATQVRAKNTVRFGLW
jgi:hypothetical protein